MKYLNTGDRVVLAVSLFNAGLFLTCGIWWAPLLFLPTWMFAYQTYTDRKQQEIRSVKMKLLGIEE